MTTAKTLLWTTQDCGARELIVDDFHSGDVPRIRAIAHTNSQDAPASENKYKTKSGESLAMGEGAEEALTQT